MDSVLNFNENEDPREAYKLIADEALEDSIFCLIHDHDPDGICSAIFMHKFLKSVGVTHIQMLSIGSISRSKADDLVDIGYNVILNSVSYDPEKEKKIVFVMMDLIASGDAVKKLLSDDERVSFVGIDHHHGSLKACNEVLSMFSNPTNLNCRASIQDNQLNTDDPYRLVYSNNSRCSAVLTMAVIQKAMQYLSKKDSPKVTEKDLKKHLRMSFYIESINKIDSWLITPEEIEDPYNLAIVLDIKLRYIVDQDNFNGSVYSDFMDVFERIDRHNRTIFGDKEYASHPSYKLNDFGVVISYRHRISRDLIYPMDEIARAFADEMLATRSVTRTITGIVEFGVLSKSVIAWEGTIYQFIEVSAPYWVANYIAHYLLGKHKEIDGVMVIPPDGSGRISLRSTNARDIDLRSICEYLGGGGHKNASGFRLNEFSKEKLTALHGVDVGEFGTVFPPASLYARLASMVRIMTTTPLPVDVVYGKLP